MSDTNTNFITAHEFAKELLKGPDIPVGYRDENLLGVRYRRAAVSRCAIYNELNGTEYTPETYAEALTRAPLLIAWDQGWEASRAQFDVEIPLYLSGAGDGYPSSQAPV